nr:MBL fold metallo-hydrolase [Rhodoligotrophos appendicifer]
MGHASYLLQICGLNLLIDPVWSPRASPFKRMGPLRVNPPGIALDALPPIDVVLITHNHYDHLDLDTLKTLQARCQPRFITALGNDKIIQRALKDARVEAGGWGQSFDIGSQVRVHLTPSYHWSARGLFDRRMALWCAFVFTSPAGVIYHIGDTGYGDGAPFRAVAQTFGPPRLAMIPIGAYEPRWFMKNQHVNPEEALQIMLDCGARQAVGHHWGTFQLTAEPIEEPKMRLESALAREGLAVERFTALRPGQSLTPE